MKSKIEACYGAEEAAKFIKGSSNWFQRFKKRHNIVLRGRTVDPKHGKWMPKNRYNVDQVPLPFVNEQDKTYDTLGAKQVWVSQPSPGLDKRQATL